MFEFFSTSTWLPVHDFSETKSYDTIKRDDSAADYARKTRIKRVESVLKHDSELWRSQEVTSMISMEVPYLSPAKALRDKRLASASFLDATIPFATP